MITTIRIATPNDAPLLPCIERSAAQAFDSIPESKWLADSSTLSVERHLQLIKLSTCWVAADADDCLQGFLSAEQQGADLHIHELSVLQSCQGKGLGRLLIQAAMDYVRENSLRAVTLTTFKSVPWNAPFYCRLGFKVMENLPPDSRLALLLSSEYEHGFPLDSRCAMAWRAA